MLETATGTWVEASHLTPAQCRRLLRALKRLQAGGHKVMTLSTTLADRQPFSTSIEGMWWGFVDAEAWPTLAAELEQIADLDRRALGLPTLKQARARRASRG